jgi:hypothetical protein
MDSLKSFDAAKFPAGLLLAAALLEFAPAFATPVAFVAYAVAGFVVSAINLKGGAAIAGVAVVVLGIQAYVIDTGAGPVQTAANAATEVVSPAASQVSDSFNP